MNTKRKVGKFMVATYEGAHLWFVATKQGQDLGHVEYHARWSQFEFVPATGTCFTWDCLKAMSEFLAELNRERSKPAEVKS